MFSRLPYVTRHLSLAALVLSALLVFMMAACGRKGPLHVPDDMIQPAEQTPAAPAK